MKPPVIHHMTRSVPCILCSSPSRWFSRRVCRRPVRRLVVNVFRFVRRLRMLVVCVYGVYSRRVAFRERYVSFTCSVYLRFVYSFVFFFVFIIIVKSIILLNCFVCFWLSVAGNMSAGSGCGLESFIKRTWKTLDAFALEWRYGSDLANEQSRGGKSIKKNPTNWETYITRLFGIRDRWGQYDFKK